MSGRGALSIIYEKDKKGNPCDPFVVDLKTFTVKSEDWERCKFLLTYTTENGDIIRMSFQPDAVYYSIDGEDRPEGTLDHWHKME